MLRHFRNSALQYKLLCVAILFAVASITFAAAIIYGRSPRNAPRATTQQEAQQAPVQVSALAYVPPGAPIIFSNLVIDSEQDGARSQFLSSLKLRVATPGTDRLTSLNLMLFEFDAGNRLRRVDGWIRGVDLAVGRTTDITLPIQRRARAGQRFVAALERAGGAAKRWETDFSGLAMGVASLVGGGPPFTPVVTQLQPVADDSGAALCGNGSRRALALAQIGDRIGITSYTCDQHDRSYQFTFNGKSLAE